MKKRQEYGKLLYRTLACSSAHGPDISVTEALGVFTAIAPPSYPLSATAGQILVRNVGMVQILVDLIFDL